MSRSFLFWAELVMPDGWKQLGDAHFRIGPIHLAQRLANLTHGRVRPNRIYDVRHGVGWGNTAVASSSGFLSGRLLQRVQAAADFVIRSRCPQSLELGGLV